MDKKKITEKVLEKLRNMPDEEFHKLLAQHTNDDVAIALHMLQDFSDTIRALEHE